jgi:uncharacterized membrane protein YfcA
VEPVTVALIAAMMFGGAVLYSTVGHAGASAYLAIMALFALPPEVMRPTALALNILVSGIATVRYWRAGLFDWKLFWPFAVTAVPAAWVAGGVPLPADIYRPILGVVLLLSAVRLLWPKPIRALEAVRAPRLPAALATGVGVGALSGLVGVGGGIFLSPIILFLGWSDPRTTSGTVAPFILVVSLSGLAGNLASVGALPAELPWFAAAVIAGGLVGTWLGAKRLAPQGILYALAAVELVAAWKLLTA